MPTSTAPFKTLLQARLSPGVQVAVCAGTGTPWSDPPLTSVAVCREVWKGSLLFRLEDQGGKWCSDNFQSHSVLFKI